MESTARENQLRYTGLDIIGNAPWGTHFCNFYYSKQDLLEILVPYFKAGLENNEFCLWITSDPVSVDDALASLRNGIPLLDQYLTSNAIELCPHANWYLKDGKFDAKHVIDGWHDKLNKAIEKGYEGIRINGNEDWLERQVWKDFIEYERELNNTITGKRMMVLCTYPLEKCTASDVLDVAQAHEMAISRRSGKWEVVEIPAIRQTKAQLKFINDMLEGVVKERTHELERAIARLNEEIENHKRTEASLEIKVTERTRELQEALEKTKELADWKSRFASVASHEFMTPLATIKIAATHIRKYRTRLTAQAINKKIAIVLEQVDLMTRMLEDLLMLGQADEQKITLEKRKIEVRAFFESLKKEIEGANKGSHIIHCKFDFRAKHIEADDDLLRNIFINLLSNAVKFSPGNSHVWLTVRDLTSALHVEIKDEGLGINPEDLSKIFEPFVRGANAKNINGTGLGLSIVKKAVDLIGGSITIKSKPGEGSVFSVIIPI
jgi:signal transduction histidine kinase